MERRGVPQIDEAKRVIGKVAHKDGYHTDHTVICFVAGLCQIGTIKIYTQNEPFCNEKQNLLGGVKNSVETIRRNQKLSMCVT